MNGPEWPEVEVAGYPTKWRLLVTQQSGGCWVPNKVEVAGYPTSWGCRLPNKVEVAGYPQSGGCWVPHISCSKGTLQRLSLWVDRRYRRRRSVGYEQRRIHSTTTLIPREANQEHLSFSSIKILLHRRRRLPEDRRKKHFIGVHHILWLTGKFERCTPIRCFFHLSSGSL